MIRFSCPTCKNLLQAPPVKAGEKIACPMCGQRLLIPNPVKPAARNKTVLGSLLPSFVKPKAENRNPVAPSSNDGMVNVTCPCCGRLIPLSPHEVSTVIQCARCLAPFNPSSFLGVQTGVRSAPQQPPSPLPDSGDERQIVSASRRDEGVQPAVINLRLRLFRFLPGAAAGLFFLGVLGLLSWLFLRSKVAEAPNPEMIRYLPNYSQIIVSVRPASIAKSELFRECVKRFPEFRKLETEFEEGLGLSVAQVKQIMLAGMNNDVGVLVCRLISPASAADILANMKDAKYQEEKVGGYTLYEKKTISNPSFCIVQKDLVLYGESRSIRSILLREGPPELSSGLQTALLESDFSKDIVIAMNSKDCYRKTWFGRNFEQKAPDELEDVMTRSDAAVAAQLTIGKAIKGRLIIHCRDTISVKELMKLIEESMTKVKTDPHTPKSVIKGLSSLRLSQEGTKLILSGVIDSEMILKVFDSDAR